MPHFNLAGKDTWICQKCGGIFACTSQWRTDITGSKSAGNVCSACVWKYDHTTYTLYWHEGMRKLVLDRPGMSPIEFDRSIAQGVVQAKCEQIARDAGVRLVVQDD